MNKRTKKAGRPRKAVVEYRGVHVRLAAQRGASKEHLCVDGCGRMASEWSLMHEATDILYSQAPYSFGKAYTLDLDMYEPRCRPCHRAYDGVTKCA